MEWIRTISELPEWCIWLLIWIWGFLVGRFTAEREGR